MEIAEQAEVGLETEPGVHACPSLAVGTEWMRGEGKARFILKEKKPIRRLNVNVDSEG